MMASGEIRLSTMTMRRMPVLAQSQVGAQSQNTSPDPGAVQSVLGLESAPLAGGGILSEIFGAVSEVLGLAFSGDTPAPTSVFWSGQGTQAAAEAWAAANGGTTLSVAAGATEAEVTAASASFAAQATGDAVVFQNAAGVPVAGQWAATEFGVLRSNSSVTGITYNIINDYAATICTISCPK
jgi:hypothetical protein